MLLPVLTVSISCIAVDAVDQNSAFGPQVFAGFIATVCEASQQQSVKTVTDPAGSLAPGTPLNEEAFLFSYPANDKVTDFLSDYLHKIAEAEVISHELVRTLSLQSYLVRASSVHDCSHSCHAL